MTRHIVLGRDGFVLLVERKDDGFGNIGGAGLLTDAGFAVLTWKGEEPHFIARGADVPGTPGQVESLRRFERDVHAALREA